MGTLVVKPRHFEGMTFVLAKGGYMPDHDDERPDDVTAPVTEEPRAKTPWEIAGMDENTWRSLEIPDFLRRPLTATTATASPVITAPAPAPAAVASSGTPSGETTKSSLNSSGVTSGFEHFRVDPEEIESKIRAEADRRWRNWTPSKEAGNKRPRLSTFLRKVRREFYP